MELALQRSLEKYVNIAGFLTSASEYKLGTRLPDETCDKWAVLLGAMRVVDYIYDSLGIQEQRNTFRENVMSYLNDSTSLDIDNSYKFYLDPLRDQVTELPSERRLDFAKNCNRIFKVTEHIRSTKSPQRLAAFTRLEGQTTSKLFLAFLPDYVFTLPTYSKYELWIQQLGRIGNIVDTFFDLSSDYEAGEALVYPSITNRLILLIQSSRDAFSALKGTPIGNLPHLGRFTKDTSENNSRKELPDVIN